MSWQQSKDTYAALCAETLQNWYVSRSRRRKCQEKRVGILLLPVLVLGDWGASPCGFLGETLAEIRFGAFYPQNLAARAFSLFACKWAEKVVRRHTVRAVPLPPQKVKYGPAPVLE